MTETGKPFKVKANDFIFHIDKSEISGMDLIERFPNEFNCIKDNRSVNAIVLQSDIAAKKFKISIDGEVFSIEIKDELDQMLEMMGFGVAANKQLTEIKAPMPGLVLQIAVEEGQQVKAGDKILILEAMKMENSIMIPGNAQIKKILVTKGQAVERGQVLVELGEAD